MGWKEFFKPTILKMILFIIMLTILNPFSFNYMIWDMECVNPPCDCVPNVYYRFFGNEIWMPCDTDYSLLQIVGFASPILEYLLSCLISYLISKK